MRKLTTEQKAKAYDEALERAKQLYVDGMPQISRNTTEYIFPELKKSEDERIRGAIIDHLKDNNLTEWAAWLEKQGEQKEINLIEILKHYPRETELYSPLYGKLWLAKVDEKNEIITCYKYPLNKGCTRAILEQEETVSFYSNGTTGLPDFNISKDCMLFLYDIEKQGEKNPTDKVEPKFQEGDWVVNKLGNIWHIDSFDAKNYQVTNNKGEHNYFPIYLQDRMRLWTIHDAKEDDVLQLGGVTAIFQKYIGNGNCKCYCSVYNGELEIPSQDGTDNNYGCHNAVPATKEQRDNLRNAMTDAGYTFDFEKKELKKIEPFDEYKGLTDFERAVADICIGWIGKELSRKQYIKDNADILLKIAVKKFNSI
jgi:hypothetical protein